MSYTCEGKIKIPGDEFWAFIMKYLSSPQEVVFGPPRYNSANQTLEINYAASDDDTPINWVVLPLATTEWKEYDEEFKKRQQIIKEN